MGAPGQDTTADAELVRRLRSGDAIAFHDLVRRYGASMRRVASTFVPSPADADDVVQDTWLAVIRGLHTFEGRSSLRSWIFAILVNRARDHARAEARQPHGPDLSAEADAGLDGGWFVGRRGRGAWREPVSAWEDDPQLALDSAEMVDWIMAEISRLPAARQQVVVLRDVEGWSAAEVSALLGISDGNQRVLLHRARNALRLAARRHRSERGGPR